MSLTMSLTEFNRFPSKAARAANLQDVVVTDRGVPRYRLTLVEPPLDPVRQSIRDGETLPARAVVEGNYGTPLPHVTPAPHLDSAKLLRTDRGRFDAYETVLR